MLPRGVDAGETGTDERQILQVETTHIALELRTVQRLVTLCVSSASRNRVGELCWWEAPACRSGTTVESLEQSGINH